MKVVLLAGGHGTRISEESEYRPKPMVEIGGMPIIWHIMKEYSFYGYNEFILCAGYKQEYIKEWFSNYFLNTSDVSFDFRQRKNEMIVHHSRIEPWKVTIVDTGLDTMTGGRIKRIQEYVAGEPFMMTYGDGVCDVNIKSIEDFHRKHGKIGTLTAVKYEQDKGVLVIGPDNAVKNFREKSKADSVTINAGYMMFNPEIFEYLTGDDCILEQEPLMSLSSNGELMTYVHTGFWYGMDSMRDKYVLEQMLQRGTAPWKKW